MTLFKTENKEKNKKKDKKETKEKNMDIVSFQLVAIWSWRYILKSSTFWWSILVTVTAV